MQALLDTIAQLDLPGDARRVFHGRGGLFPGCEHWALDAFPPVWLLTSFQPVSDDSLAILHVALSERWQQLAPQTPLNWVFQCRHLGRTETRLMAGSVPEPHLVTEDGARYRVHMLKGQNHGLFLDMAEGRRWVRGLVAARPGLRLLNLFAYTCAFSVVARQAGGGPVVNVDMSHGTAHWPSASRTTSSTACWPAPAFWPTTSSAPGARLRAPAPMAWSSSTRPATSWAASWPPRTTPA